MDPSHRSVRIDALRGLAALTVLIYHARAELWGGLGHLWKTYHWHAAPSVWLAYLTYPFSYGWVAVLLFFVLSGYCIHHSGAKQLAAHGREGRVPWRVYFWRRFWRIYPTYVAALLLTLAIDADVAGRVPTLINGTHSAAAFLGSLLTVQNILVPPYGTSNTVFWSLAVEVHLYLFYPLMFWISREHGAKTALGVAFLVSLIAGFGNDLLSILGTGWQMPGPNFMQYLFCWMLGFYAAEIRAGRQQEVRIAPVAYLALLVSGVVTFALHGQNLSLFLLGAGFFGVILDATQARHGPPSWFFRGAAMVGLFSYSLYAIHRSIMRLLHSFYPDPNYRTSAQLVLAGIVLSLIAGAVFYALVEFWSEKISRRRFAPVAPKPSAAAAS